MAYSYTIKLASKVKGGDCPILTQFRTMCPIMTGNLICLTIEDLSSKNKDENYITMKEKHFCVVNLEHHVNVKRLWKDMREDTQHYCVVYVTDPNEE